MRTPCINCGVLVLPKTFKVNNGFCGQCARDPAAAIRNQARRLKIAAMGVPTLDNVRSRLVELIEISAKEACQRFSGEVTYAFVLHSDPHFESVVARVMTDRWASKMPPGARWGGFGWFDQDYMIREAEFEIITEWAWGLDKALGADRGDLLFPCYMEALRNVGAKRIFPSLTGLLLIADGMGYEEIFAIAEMLNSEESLARLRNEFPLDTELLAKMRVSYHQLHV